MLGTRDCTVRGSPRAHCILQPREQRRLLGPQETPNGKLSFPKSTRDGGSEQQKKRAFLRSTYLGVGVGQGGPCPGCSRCSGTAPGSSLDLDLRSKAHSLLRHLPRPGRKLRPERSLSWGDTPAEHEHPFLGGGQQRGRLQPRDLQAGEIKPKPISHPLGGFSITYKPVKRQASGPSTALMSRT
ncbi:40S ribosomal protein S15-like [Sorex araneus]|uniref:40S ribosomal protein S15-like n=1 Tax=Sorex araneus TaxID=42254 RepID=UPI0024333A8E|nr:40S ribosomal protein S15-like [Sorex araneus]